MPGICQALFYLSFCSYQVIQSAADIYLVMEFVSGGELFDYIAEQKK